MIRLIGRFSSIRSPIDIGLFKTPDGIQLLKDNTQRRYKQQCNIDKIVQSFASYRKLLYQLEMINKEINANTRKYQKELHQPNKEGHIVLKQNKNKLQDNINALKQQLERMLKQVGNIVHEKVPVSKNEDQNVVLKTYQPQLTTNNKLSYHQICLKQQLVDLKRGQKVGGHRGYFLKGVGVKLALALAQYGTNFLTKKNYTLYQPPTIIKEDILKNSSQLDTVQKDMYKLEGQNAYLIATSEQSLAGLYEGQTISSSQFPIRMGGYSNCYRKEAGAHGKDIEGIFRVHEFQKVQQFTICKAQESEGEMNRMLQVSEQFYQSLDIPYRVVDIVSGELNDAAIRKFDLEGWYPSQNKYRELVSISNCTNYQSRMLGVTYLEGNNRKYPHMLNGTLIAIERAMTCILENNFDGNKIRIPNVLKSYIDIE